MADVYVCSTPQFERSKFYTRKQKETETIHEYLLELKRLATPCEFGAFWNEAIRDCFIMGIRNIETRNVLLYTRDLNLEQAENIAMAKEAIAQESSRDIHETLAIAADPSTLPQNGDSRTSNHISKPGTSQNIYLDSEESSNENSRENLITASNPQQLSYSYMANANQGPGNGYTNGGTMCEYNGISPAQDPTLHHNTSMPGTSQEFYNISHSSPNKNTRACLATTSNPQPTSVTTQGTPSISNEGGQNPEQSLIPVKSPDGKKKYICTICKKEFPHKSNIERHLNTHTKTILFHCCYCNKSFALQSTHFNHELICKQNPDKKVKK